MNDNFWQLAIAATVEDDPDLQSLIAATYTVRWALTLARRHPEYAMAALAQHEQTLDLLGGTDVALRLRNEIEHFPEQCPLEVSA